LLTSALCTLLSALVVLLCSSPECKGEDTVTQPEGDASVFKGDTATINCTFQTTDSYPYLFWYKQEDGNNSPDFDISRFDAEIKENSVYLKIQRVRVSDSAVYYCALSEYMNCSRVMGCSDHRLFKMAPKAPSWTLVLIEVRHLSPSVSQSVF
uniref:Ig-like domain-containing protein n=1 Tax=Neogobius melanostomus TaxID=47308 RepID=A0A8C6WPI7_9GOBI